MKFYNTINIKYAINFNAWSTQEVIVSSKSLSISPSLDLDMYSPSVGSSNSIESKIYPFVPTTLFLPYILV